MDQFVLCEGTVEATLANVKFGGLCLARLDTDYYKSTRHELAVLYPQLAHGGVLIIDDYGHFSGVRRAVDEFFRDPRNRCRLYPIDYSGRSGIKLAENGAAPSSAQAASTPLSSDDGSVDPIDQCPSQRRSAFATQSIQIATENPLGPHDLPTVIPRNSFAAPALAAHSPAADVDNWLAGLDQPDGIHLVSPPRPFAHDEAAFDAGLRLDQSIECIGNGLITQLRREGYDFSLPALEIGCGGGTLSIGLAKYGDFSRLILSDPSPAFLAILRRRLTNYEIDSTRLRYAMLAAEDIDRLPAQAFRRDCVATHGPPHSSCPGVSQPGSSGVTAWRFPGVRGAVQRSPGADGGAVPVAASSRGCPRIDPYAPATRAE